jgi:hypothetical protein
LVGVVSSVDGGSLIQALRWFKLSAMRHFQLRYRTIAICVVARRMNGSENLTITWEVPNGCHFKGRRPAFKTPPRRATNVTSSIH